MIDFNSNIRLMPSENSRFQTVYASQSYGTFYAIFARFTVKDIFEEDSIVKKKKLLERVELKLVNYKGLLNMGLVRETEADPNAYEAEAGVKSLLIKVNVKGAAGGDTTDSDEILFNPPVVIENGMYLSLIRELISLAGEDRAEFSENPLNPEIGGVFDQEFYERDGLLVRKKETIGFSLNESNESVSGSEYQTIVDLNFPGKVCHIGLTKINIE
ncbi:hypothetical protein [Spongiimicrobium salis]|uniref:hypothetical protein n=1 Tax=Spongiimicrobium salis TaxID=1667022 RepID=UPI00374D0AF5